MFTIADVHAAEDSRGNAYNLTGAAARHFKAGANAAWSSRWTDANGNHNLDRAEDWYEAIHGAAAAGHFADGWCWGASQ